MVWYQSGSKWYPSGSVAGGYRPPPLRSSPHPRAYGSGCVCYAPAFAGGAPAAHPPAPPFLPSRSLGALFVAPLVRAVHSSASCNISNNSNNYHCSNYYPVSVARCRGAGAFTALRATFPRSAPLPLRLFALLRRGGASSGCGRVHCPSGDVSALRSPAFATFCAVALGVVRRWRGTSRSPAPST